MREAMNGYSNLLEVGRLHGDDVRDAQHLWDTLRAALTDAPPVFTLEEVTSAMAEDGHSLGDTAAIAAILTTLRR